MNDSSVSVSGAASTEPGSTFSWKQIVAQYQKPAMWRGIWQVTNTLVPYAGLWYLIHLTSAISFWLTLPLVLLAAGFLVRIFIIFHDCGHGSFFGSRLANDVLGTIAGVLCFTPYYHWRWEHAIHHSSAGDLDRRGTGDVWTLTVQEYLEASRWHRFAYRLARNPLILFVLAPIFLFFIRERFPSPKAGLRERFSVYLTNFSMLVVAIGMIWLFGFKTYLLVQPVLVLLAGSAGIWLFYVQHQFEGVYWERGEEWDYTKAALQGSSYYKLPRVLQWFSGNIGFHHIHHLSPRIPNYHLERCHKAEPLFRKVKPVTLLSSFKSLGYRLWDEQRQQMVGFPRLQPVRSRVAPSDQPGHRQ